VRVRVRFRARVRVRVRFRVRIRVRVRVKMMVREISRPALVAEVILRPKVSTLMIADCVSPKMVPRIRSVLENFFLRISHIATIARVAIANLTESIAGTVAYGVIALAER
jgi:hypothetical protein